MSGFQPFKVNSFHEALTYTLTLKKLLYLAVDALDDPAYIEIKNAAQQELVSINVIKLPLLIADQEYKISKIPKAQQGLEADTLILAAFVQCCQEYLAEISAEVPTQVSVARSAGVSQSSVCRFFKAKPGGWKGMIEAYLYRKSPPPGHKNLLADGTYEIDGRCGDEVETDE